MESAPPIRVCFVCLGNICRSPTAEVVLLAELERRGLRERFGVDSAGTAAYHLGKLADARTRRHAERRGYAITHRARQFGAEDFARFDYVLAMDRENLRNLEALRPSTFSGVLRLFRSYDPTVREDQDMPDPYYGGDEGFERVLDYSERAAAGFLDRLRSEGRIP